MEEFIQELKTENAMLNQQASQLRAQNKDDEAIFCTVRANVYDICATVCRVHLGKGNISAFSAMLARFREEWSAALEAARRRDDARKICIEETKLEALADICARFAAAGGE